MAVIAAGGGAGGGGGAPTGAAGGDLSGTYPNPSVVDDSHAHTAATLPATMPPSVHAASHAAGGSDTLNGQAVGVLTQLDVDNLRLDANTILSTNSNGDINIDPNGTGLTILPDKALVFGSKTTNGDSRLRAVSSSLEVRTGEDAQYGNLKAQNVYALRYDGAAGLTAQLDGENRRMLLGGSAGIAWVATAVVRAIDSGTGIGAIEAAREVEANTAGSGSPNLLLGTESRKLLTNEGATAENYHTLPSAVAGLEFVFYVQDTDGIRVVANAGDTIRIGATVSAAAGFVRNATVGSVLHLVAINATEWVPIATTGTWTVDV